jgi:tetratricopeptide (TPR) repeat protein
LPPYREEIVLTSGSPSRGYRRKRTAKAAILCRWKRPRHHLWKLFRTKPRVIPRWSRARTIAAIASFERATAIDPNFAMAYMYLGVAYENAGNMARSREYAGQTFRLIDRVSEYERAQIAPYYRATGEVYKEIDAWQSSIRNYPRIWSFHNQLGVVYIDLGQYMRRG